MKNLNLRNMQIRAVGLLVLLTLTVACAAQQTPAPRVVDLAATDGTKLKATFFSAGKPGPGVLLLHQCNLQRKGWDDLAAQLATAGISVLTLDYRGYGESEGCVTHVPAGEESGSACWGSISAVEGRHDRPGVAWLVGIQWDDGCGGRMRCPRSPVLCTLNVVERVCR